MVLSTALLLGACGGNSIPDQGGAPDPLEPDAARIVSGPEAIATPEPSKIDLQTMNDAEIGKAVPPGPGCTFAYTRHGDPVVAIRGMPGPEPAQAVVKIHGDLVRLRTTSPAALETLAGGAIAETQGIRITIAPVDMPRIGKRGEADLRLMLDNGFEVGYGGFYRCIGGDQR